MAERRGREEGRAWVIRMSAEGAGGAGRDELEGAGERVERKEVREAEVKWGPDCSCTAG